MNAHYIWRVRDIDGARRLHGRATPTFYVNGVLGHLVRRSLHDAVATTVEIVSG
jgi:hypothetical protein